jgi:uncharacterized membrane protein YcaP (DUF421 family)
MLLQIHWHTFFFGDEDWRFLQEVLLRTTVMFMGAYIAMRMMGRRAVIQGIFEIVLIICLGSAAGDAMFYSNVGVLPCLLVLAVVVIEYSLLNYFMALWPRFERVMEGKILPLIDNGMFAADVLKRGHFTLNEILADLRLVNVSQLGQVKRAYVEANGRISVFYFPDSEVRYGLCILPEHFDKPQRVITEEAYYSCTYCGFTRLHEPTARFSCPRCENDECTRSSKEIRLK